jgi:cytochrome c oxidase assembly factor CtaG
VPSVVAAVVLGVATAVALGGYEAGGRGLHPAPPRWQRWCAWASAASVAGAVAVPWSTGAAGGPVWMVTLQLCLLLFATTPLAVLACPFARWRHLVGRDGDGATIEPAPSSEGWRRWAPLAPYAAVVIAWRLPGPVDALARVHALVAVEAVTAVAGSWALWRALVGPQTSGGRRVVLAVPAVWLAWIVAYVLGFSSADWFRAYGGLHGPMGAVADQEIAAMVMFVASAAALVPVAFAGLTRWLGADAARGPLALPDFRRDFRPPGRYEAGDPW